MPDVSTHNLAYGRMAEHWALPNTLMGGTPAMREAGVDYLPQFPRESNDAYKARIESTFLYPAYEEAVNGAVSRIFSKELTAQGNQLTADIVEDCDLEGTDLNSFAADATGRSIAKGHGFILVDMPENDGTLSLAEEKELEIRPYMQFVAADSVISFKFKRVGGKRILSEVRIQETAVEPDGDWGEKSVEQIRVLTPGAWQIWRQDSKKKSWTVYQGGETTLSYIPLVPVYINKKADFESRPPFLSLAWKNVEHWQSSSDQRNILHVSRFPVWFGSGFDTDSKDIAFGPHAAILQSSPDAKFDPKEPQGKGTEQGWKDLDKLEQHMEMLAKKPLMPRHGAKTATEVSRDDSQANTQIKQWALSVKDAIERALAIAHDWVNDGAEASVSINTDFDLALSNDDMELLQKMEAASQITKETLWKEAKRRNLLEAEFDGDAEFSRLKEQAPVFVDDPVTGALNNAIAGA